MPDYQDFELEIGCDSADGAPRQYFAHVIRSPAGEAERSPVKFRFSEPKELAKLRADLESAVLDIDGNNVSVLTSRAERVLRDFGREIFDSIFVNIKSISNIYAQSKDKDIRIKLRISSPDLATLPWEYLYEEDEVISYVSLRLPLVRYLETAGAAGPMGVTGPLRILGMISNPGTDEWPKLDAVKERDRIDKGIDKLERDGQVVFKWVTGGTAKDLMYMLQEGGWHIFHFIGHGGIEPQSPTGPAGNSYDQSGFIVMVDEDGKPAKKFASDLAMMLGMVRKSLRLVVLNCCDSAKVNVGEKFGNPAIGMMRGGWLPAVVAMQFPITDGAATGMSEGFYNALANNAPIDDAITTARKFIQVQSKVEFGIPVLYMRSADGKIFDVVNPRPAAGVATAASQTMEGLQQRRDAFMLATDPIPASAAELDELARQGQSLLAGLKDDDALAKRVARIYLDLGTLQQRQNQISKAAASFAYAIKLDPKNPVYYVRRANFNAMVGFFEAALADITAAIGLKSEAEYYWIKGIICTTASGPQNQRGFLEQAIEAFGTAIGMKPSEPKYLASRASAFAQLKSWDEALKDIERAMELAPDDAGLFAERGRITALKA
jgi:tetratricopeptide (TPR) repeat protein